MRIVNIQKAIFDIECGVVNNANGIGKIANPAEMPALLCKKRGSIRASEPAERLRAAGGLK